MGAHPTIVWQASNKLATLDNSRNPFVGVPSAVYPSTKLTHSYDQHSCHSMRLTSYTQNLLGDPLGLLIAISGR